MAYLPGAYHDGAYESGLSSVGDDYYDYGSRPGDRYFDDPYDDMRHGAYYGESGVGYQDLCDYTDFVQEPIGLYDAWGDDSWDAEQYALADLMYYQQQLELDSALSQAQRLRRWEDRLAWEQLDEEERALRYHELAASGALGALGLAGGFWGRRFGQMDHDLSYLRSVPLQRGVFGGPYRHAFARHPGLAQRYSPHLSRHRLRAYQQPIQPWSVAYHSQRLSSPVGARLGLREQELWNRLRIAELRASLTGLDTASRAQALEDARRLRAEIESEARLAREIDRSERRSDALYVAAEAEAERREWRHEAAERDGIDRLAAAADDLLTRPIYSALP